MGHFRRNKNWKRIYYEDGSYTPLSSYMDEEELYESTREELIKKHGLWREDYGLFFYDPKEAIQDAVSALENRDPMAVARRNRRRVFAEQDDRRLRDPNLDDFNHTPERQYHDKIGRVQSIRQTDLPRNVNITKEGTQGRNRNWRAYQNREVIDRLRASICGKRKARREVLFATKKTGKGSKARQHLWSKVSKIICK